MTKKYHCLYPPGVVPPAQIFMDAPLPILLLGKLQGVIPDVPRQILKIIANMSTVTDDKGYSCVMTRYNTLIKHGRSVVHNDVYNYFMGTMHGYQKHRDQNYIIAENTFKYGIKYGVEKVIDNDKLFKKSFYVIKDGVSVLHGPHIKYSISRKTGKRTKVITEYYHNDKVINRIPHKVYDDIYVIVGPDTPNDFVKKDYFQ